MMGQRIEKMALNVDKMRPKTVF